VDERIIAYTLTDEAQEVKIKIYTASGRLIRTFDFVNEVGYYIEHGCDEMGDEVANGVYYMRFVAKRGQERIERIEKIVRLK
jgi:flagellar hook assembly protein FlgD